jgi:hypothetical protein
MAVPAIAAEATLRAIGRTDMLLERLLSTAHLPGVS